MDSTATALRELERILQRSHETLESELRTWISQQLAPPVAAPSWPGAGEGCFEPEATDVIFPALETRLAKTSGQGPALRGDADEDALAPDSSVQVSSLALPTFAGARPRRHSRMSKGSVCSADVGESSADVVTVLSQVSSGRRSRWAEPEQEAMARMRSKKDGKKAAKPKPTKNLCRRMIEHPWFDRIFAFMIIASSVAVGAEVEYTALAMSNELPPIFAGLQILFFLAFLAELSIRLAAFRKNFFFAFDAGWNIFDLVVVIFAGIEAQIEVLEAEQEAELLREAVAAALEAVDDDVAPPQKRRRVLQEEQAEEEPKTQDVALPAAELPQMQLPANSVPPPEVHWGVLAILAALRRED
ncbi:Scn11a [Symbiodinium sp. CCMP2592]|nr:Scn11a [Symbiodinium sp. CCMP2592]